MNKRDNSPCYVLKYLSVSFYYNVMNAFLLQYCCDNISNIAIVIFSFHFIRGDYALGITGDW